MSDFYEIDPDTGIKSVFKWSENDQQYTIHRSQDVQGVLDYAKERRARLGLDRPGIKESWWCYATIPAGVMLELRAKGLHVGNRDHEKRIIEEINTNYPHLKTVEAKVGGKVKSIVLL